MKKLLGIFSHPFDESILSGGTIAKYVKSGWIADIVTVTRGEAGSSVNSADDRPLADVRRDELEAACGHLGIRSVTYLDFRDGKLSQETPGSVEDAIIKAIAVAQPDIVITHDPTGGTNHPDHVRISYSVTYAFQEYARVRALDMPGDTNPPKLYYACFPETALRYLVRSGVFPPELHDKPVIGTADKRITTVIEIARSAGAKRKAILAHASQADHTQKYLSPNNPFLRQEYFTMRYSGVVEVFVGKNDRVSDRL